MIAKFWGIRGSSRASFVLMTLLPSNRNAGRSEGRPPVAMMASVKVTQSDPSAFRTSRSFGPMNEAVPARPRSDDHDIRVPGHQPTEQLRSLNLFADAEYSDATHPKWTSRYPRKSSRDVRGSSGPTGRTPPPRDHRLRGGRRSTTGTS